MDFHFLACREIAPVRGFLIPSSTIHLTLSVPSYSLFYSFRSFRSFFLSYSVPRTSLITTARCGLRHCLLNHVHHSGIPSEQNAFMWFFPGIAARKLFPLPLSFFASFFLFCYFSCRGFLRMFFLSCPWA